MTFIFLEGNRHSNIEALFIEVRTHEIILESDEELDQKCFEECLSLHNEKCKCSMVDEESQTCIINAGCDIQISGEDTHEEDRFVVWRKRENVININGFVDLSSDRSLDAVRINGRKETQRQLIRDINLFL